MPDAPVVYAVFNRIEGVLWLGMAVGLLFVIKRRSRRQTIAVWLASLGFVLFGLTDFLEAPLYGQIPWWLWAGKIACATLILCCRYIYLGWHRFHLRDRYFLFGLFCLVMALGVMVMQYYLFLSDF